MHIAKNIVIVIVGLILVSIAYGFVKKGAEPQTPLAEPAPLPATETTPALITAAIGQSVTVGAVSIMPTAVLEDSRCPANVQCIWAGRVRVQVAVTNGTVQQLIEITLGESLVVAGKTIALVAVRPEPLAGEKPASAAYEFDFKVQ
ncbi:MAG TPA: hypothetical protein VLB02_01370 [Candidatus Paceibacterota bacterium]|nr:hypothetical protein [Candidatus Paceibacterota bacterium]